MLERIRYKVQSNFNSLLRFFRSGGKKINFSGFKLNKIRFDLKIFNIKFLFFTAFALFAFVIFFNIYIYTRIDVSNYRDENLNRENLSSLYNIAILAINSEADLNYIEYGGVLSVNENTKDLKLISFNSDYIVKSPDTNKEITYKTYLNNVNENKIVSAINTLEQIFSVNIQRYIIFETDNIATYNFITAYSIDPSLKPDKKLSLEKINEYIQTQIVDYDRKNSFYSNLITSTLSKNTESELKLYSTYLNLNEFLNFFYTDMTKDELLSFLYDLYNSNGFTKVTEVNSKFGFEYDTGFEIGVRLDSIYLKEALLDHFKEIDILAEQAQVEIYNATIQSGFARTNSNKLQNFGVNIIKEGNYFELSNETKIYILDAKPEKYSKTIETINRELGKTIPIYTEEYPRNYTGDIILVLGADII